MDLPHSFTFIADGVPELTRDLDDLTIYCYVEEDDRWLLNCLMGNLGRRFAEIAESIGPNSVAIVSDRVETLLSCGDEYVETAVATGFLEGLVHYIDRHPELKWARHAMGPEAIAYLKAYDKLMGVDRENPEV